MAGKRRPRAVPCGCGAVARWDAEEKLYVCGRRDGDTGAYVEGCGMWYSEDNAPTPDDGRIRSPEDVAVRLGAAAEVAAKDGRLADIDRDYLGLCHDVGDEHHSVQIAMSDYYAADQLDRHRTQVVRARERLTQLGYLRRMQPKEVTMYALRAWIEARRAQRARVPVLLELRRGPSSFPGCAECGEPIPDIERVSRRYCSAACRQRARRKDLSR